MNDATKPAAVHIGLLREAIARTLLETHDDVELARITECAKWTGTAIFDFFGKSFGDIDKVEAIVGCRLLAHILLDVADGLENATVRA